MNNKINNNDLKVELVEEFLNIEKEALNEIVKRGDSYIVEKIMIKFEEIYKKYDN